MFDIGFWELIVIAVMGLLVLGPERLPVAIRTVKGWISGVRKFSDTVKTELSEELRIHEMHANLKKAEESGMKNLSPEVEESLKSLKEAAEMVTRPYETKKPQQSNDVTVPAELSSSAPSEQETKK